MDKTLSQKNLVNLVNFVEQEIVTDYCTDLHVNCLCVMYANALRFVIYLYAYHACFNSDLCTSSFTLLFNCADMYRLATLYCIVAY